MKKALFIAIIILLCNSCEDLFNTTVEYYVTCNPAGFDITYENKTGNTEQRTVNSTSWSTSFEGHSGDFVYISAQANNYNAQVNVQIKYNDKVLKKASSSGDFVIATASGSVP